MKIFSFTIIFYILFIFKNVYATPLVDAQWLKQNFQNDDIVLLDIRPKDFYDYVRIPNSVHSPYSQWRQPQSKILRKMIPDKNHIESLLSNTGITKDSHIIIVSNGEASGDLAAASRVYWTLDQIDHHKKSILNGGIISWAQLQYPLTREQPKPVNQSNYQIKNIKSQINYQSVQQAIDQGEQIIDTRSIAEFKGIILPAPDERVGTIPSSKPLPYDWFSQNKSGFLHTTDNLKNIAQSINFDNSQPAIVYCHTGHRAALSWFVLHEILGNKNVKLYDASTREWATNPDLPLTTEINVEF